MLIHVYMYLEIYKLLQDSTNASSNLQLAAVGGGGLGITNTILTDVTGLICYYMQPNYFLVNGNTNTSNRVH